MSIPLYNHPQSDFGRGIITEIGSSQDVSVYKMLITRRVLMDNAGRSNRRVAEKEWSSGPGSFKDKSLLLAPSSTLFVVQRRPSSKEHGGPQHVVLCVVLRTPSIMLCLSAIWHGVCGRLSMKRLYAWKMPRHGWLL